MTPTVRWCCVLHSIINLFCLCCRGSRSKVRTPARYRCLDTCNQMLGNHFLSVSSFLNGSLFYQHPKPDSNLGYCRENSLYFFSRLGCARRLKVVFCFLWALQLFRQPRNSTASVGQRWSPWPCSSVTVEIQFNLGVQASFSPCTMYALNNASMLSVSIEGPNIEFLIQENCLEFWAITTDSISRPPQGQKSAHFWCP